MRTGMGNIALYVCCHRESQIPAHPLLRPIQAGTALAERRFPGYLHDDEGENISERNRAYCELTAQYWAWKNSGAEYCGFFHYRRFLYPDTEARRPYRLCRLPTETTLKDLGYDHFDKLVRQYDLILPMREEMFVPVREHYSQAPYHHGEDLARMERVIAELYPEAVSAADVYLSGTVQYFGNIFIMRRDLFETYCTWLFPLLEEFDRRTDTTGWSPQEVRVDGYLAERLLGVFVQAYGGTLKTLELPRVVFCGGAEYAKKSLLNMLLPPNSRRRSVVKGMRQGNHG